MYDDSMSLYCGPNDGGVKRGDRADTGDLEAHPDELADEAGSGHEGNPYGGHRTGDASALAGGPGASTAEPDAIGDNSGGIDDLSVYDASEPTLGLTNIGEVPPEDWAANTGSTQADEASDEATSQELDSRKSTLSRPKRKHK